MTVSLLRLASALLFFTSALACPAGYSTWYRGYCYKVVNSYNADATIRNCNDRSVLISVHSDFENAYLRKMTQSSQWILLGLACNKTTGAFVWTDGTPYDYNNFPKPTKCQDGAYYAMDSDLKWTTGGWGSDYYSACRLPHKSDSPCDEFNQVGTSTTCVQISTDAATWQSAEQTCASQNAHLAAIHNIETNDFVHDSALALGVQNGLHIGLSSNASEKSFAWSDGSPTDYFNYANGFPNDFFGHCTAMQMGAGGTGGKWMSAHCGATTKLPFACTRPSWQKPQKPRSPPDCPANPDLTGSGELFSPTYPLGFPANQSCDYFLAADDGSQVQIDFDDFETNSCCDTLTLYEGLFGGSPIAVLSGILPANKRRYKTSTDNVMRLQWRTGDGVDVKGWHARFTSV